MPRGAPLSFYPPVDVAGIADADTATARYPRDASAASATPARTSVVEVCLEPDADNEGEDSLPPQGSNAEGLIALRGGAPPPSCWDPMPGGGGWWTSSTTRTTFKVTNN